jgi:NAD(P)-dependent dehydrogenase (short-subunit alcohol dehydrogenase family)
MKVRLKPLSKQTIVITGASSGNGLAIATAAANAGARLVLAARNEPALASIAQDLGPEKVAYCAADVASEADVTRIADLAIERFGGFDTWINDAAAATYGAMEDVSRADHRRIIDVNYHGILMGSLIAARHFRERGGGAIINLGSVLSDRAMIYQGAYSASKAAVQAATDALRMELERDGAPISVTLIKPASIHTPYPEHARNLMDAPPRLPPPLYDPRLVADAVLFACENPRRHIYVGGGGFLISLAGRLAPRLTDLAMERFGVDIQKDPADPGDTQKRDNLYQPRRDGTIDGSQDVFVRRTSALLELQKNPLGFPFAAAGALMEVLTAASSRGGPLRRRKPVVSNS